MRRATLVGGICFLLGAMLAAMAATAIRPEQFIALPWSWTATQTFDGSHTITGLPTPSGSGDAATKDYVDSQVIAAGSGTVTSITCNAGLTGGTITTSGTCALDLTHANIWTGLQSMTDGDFALKGSSSGTTTLKASAAAGSTTITFPAATGTAAVLGTPQSWTATQTFDASHTITGLPTPGVSSDAATKGYVDGQIIAAGSGTVTSVGFSVPASSIFGATGTPITTTGTLGLTVAGTSGGIPYFDTTSTLSSSGALTNHAIVLGGGAGAAPTVLGSLGTSTTLLHGAAAGAPTFSAVDLAADVTGNLSVSHLNSGTSASNTTFWRGDGTWVTPAGSGTVTSITCGTGLTGGTITTTGTCAADASVVAEMGTANEWSAAQTFDDGDLIAKGSSSGSSTIKAPATGGGTATLPSGSGTLVYSNVATLSSLASIGTITTGVWNGTRLTSSYVPTDVAYVDAAQTWTATQSSTPQTLTISTATFTPAAASGNNIKITLIHASCPCTIANPSGSPVAGTSGVIEIIQSATGSDTIGTWGSQYEAAGGVAALTLSTAANAKDRFSYYVSDSTHITITSAALNVTH